jgi:ATP-dependent DNA helicase RecG
MFDKTLIKNFVSSLPFTLTASQRLAAWEILKDLEKPHPMNRLLEGEVGSGKTVVAGLCMLEVAQQGYQSVLLAPTEILAWQHYQTLKQLFKNTGLEIAIVTRSRKEIHNSSPPPLTFRGGESTPSLNIREGGGELLEGIANGQIKIIIGTHALLQDQIKFKNIGLLVVDEQHRFGVKQRGQLLNHEGKTDAVPHLLSMTATPIPRTLALAFYGDLDISQLRQLPSGRKPVITRLVAPQNRTAAYEFIRKGGKSQISSEPKPPQ